MESSQALQHRRNVGLWIVLGICLLASTIVAVGTRWQVSEDLPATQDVVTGLIYFLEQHAGRFPANAEEFLASPFVTRRPDGAIVIRPAAGTRYRAATNGVAIRDLEPFRIRWGVDLSTLHIDESGRLRDAEQREVELVRWPASPPSARKYSVLLAGISEKLREHAASAGQPGTSAAASSPAGDAAGPDVP